MNGPQLELPLPGLPPRREPETKPRHLARRRDPASSREAAARAITSGLVKGHDARIMRVLAASSCGPLTAKTIGHLAGLTNVQVCRRLGPNGKLRTEALAVLVPGPGEQRFVVGVSCSR